MRNFTLALCLLTGMLTLYSCQKNLERASGVPDEIPGTRYPRPTPTPSTCPPTNIEIVDYGDAVVGNLRITN